MPFLAVILVFTICGSADPFAPADRCEQGELLARSCRAGEAYLRDGLRPGQTLHLTSCTPRQP